MESSSFLKQREESWAKAERKEKQQGKQMYFCEWVLKALEISIWFTNYFNEMI